MWKNRKKRERETNEDGILFPPLWKAGKLQSIRREAFIWSVHCGLILGCSEGCSITDAMYCTRTSLLMKPTTGCLLQPEMLNWAMLAPCYYQGGSGFSTRCTANFLRDWCHLHLMTVRVHLATSSSLYNALISIFPVWQTKLSCW